MKLRMKAMGCRAAVLLLLAAAPGFGQEEKKTVTDDRLQPPLPQTGPTYEAFHPGAVWLDNRGEAIQAHGGGILHHEGTYYWFGENKAGPTLNAHRVDVVGISCYSSKDLYNWKWEGLALAATPDEPDSDLHPSRVVERPKVVYNPGTKKFVMWMHIDAPDYSLGKAGVAVSDSPAGPYAYLGSEFPCDSESRDMTLFRDGEDAYLIFGSGWHTHIKIAKLTPDYLRTTEDYVEILQSEGPPLGREAPAIFKRKGRYYLITSGTTGWEQNPAEYAAAENIMGPWKTMGSPCEGPLSELTFVAQSTFALPVQGKEDAFIFMADRWKNHNLGDSRYIWLPIEFEQDRLVIRWQARWDLGFFD